MRTKFIYLITLVAAIVSFSGLTSCKDTSEDDYNQLKTEVSSVSSSLQDQITKLQNLQTALQNKVDSLNAVYNANFATKTDLAALKTEITESLAAIKQCSCDQAAVNQAIADLWTALGGTVDKSELGSMIDDYLNSTAEGATNTVINNLIQQFLNSGNYVTETWVNEQLNAQKEALEAQIAAIKVCNKKCEAFFNTEETYTLSDIIALINEANTAALTAKTIANSALSKANEAFDLAGRDSLRIDTLNFAVTAIITRLNAVVAKADAAYDLAERDSAAIEKFNERFDSLAGVVDAVRDSLPIISQAIVDSIANVRLEIAAALDSAKKYADQQDALLLAHIKQHCDSLKTLDGKIDAANLKIAQIDSAYQYADSVLQDQIDSLVVKVNDLDTRLTAVETLLAKEIPAMKNRLDKIENALLKQVTGVIVQATQNQIFGGFNTPFGIKSNALLGWYGTCETAFDFPEAGYDYFLGSEASALNPEVYSPESNQLIDEDAAGKIYLTINPSNVDFSGVVLPLVNSQDKNSGIKLSPLQKSDYTIAFGYTRAADNGFYEATATFDNINEVQSLHFDKTGIVNDVKDLLDKVNLGNVKALATDVAKIVANNVNNQLDANAIKVSYTDSIGDQEVTRNIYSEYNVATAIFHPLSFESIDGIADKLEGKEHFFGYDKVCNFIDRITDKLHFSLDNSDLFDQIDDLKLDLNNFNIEHIDAIQLDEDVIQFTMTIDTLITVNGYDHSIKNDLNGLYIVIGGTKYYIQGLDGIGDIHIADQKIHITFTKSVEYDLKPLLSEMNGMVTDVNAIFDQIQGLINDANTIFATIEDYRNRVGNAIDNVHDRILSFIDRLEAPFLKLLHKSGKLLKPVMAVKSDNGYGIASQMRVKPTVVKGDVYLHPTTFNAELLAPAFKKYVAVTAVFDAAGEPVTTQALLQSLNTNGLNEVKSGSTTTLKLTGLQAGYTYKIAYIAVDYYGKQDGQVIYVKAN